MLQSNNTDNLEPISLSSLVELSVVATSGQDQIGEDMKNFAEQLKPYPLSFLILLSLASLKRDMTISVDPENAASDQGRHCFHKVQEFL